MTESLRDVLGVGVTIVAAVCQDEMLVDTWGQVVTFAARAVSCSFHDWTTGFVRHVDPFVRQVDDNGLRSRRHGLRQGKAAKRRSLMTRCVSTEWHPAEQSHMSAIHR